MTKREGSQLPLLLRIGSELFIKLFCRGQFEVYGEDNVVRAKTENPKGTFIIVSSHISNLDATATIKVFGKYFDLQMVVESVLFGLTPQEILFQLGGRKNFSPVLYKKQKRGKHGAFDPQDFERLTRQMKQGKTPWIVIHPFTTKGQMLSARIGPIYLAQKTNSQIIPVALEVYGATVSLEGPLEYIKGLVGGMKAKYHIGSPIILKPIDISVIERVLAEKKRGEDVTDAERWAFKRVHRQLREQADQIAQTISQMLPEQQRGVYGLQ